MWTYSYPHVCYPPGFDLAPELLQSERSPVKDQYGVEVIFGGLKLARVSNVQIAVDIVSEMQRHLSSKTQAVKRKRLEFVVLVLVLGHGSHARRCFRRCTSLTVSKTHNDNNMCSEMDAQKLKAGTDAARVTSACQHGFND